MADKDKKTPTLNRSSASSVVIAAPILAGLGVGAKKLYDNPAFRSHFQAGGLPGSRVKAVEMFGAQESTTAAVDYIKKLQGLKNAPTPVNADLIQTAWRTALMKSKGTNPLLEPFDPTQPFKAIEFFAQHNQSFAGQKVLSSFMNQVSTLGGHEELTGIALNGATFKAMAPHAFFKKRVRDLSQFGTLSPILEEIQSGIRQGDSRAVVEWMLHSREGFAGKQLMMHVSGGRFGRKGSALEIPFESGVGVIQHGVTQQTKRITGRYGFINPETHQLSQVVTHDMMVATMFRERILPQLARSNMTSAESNRIMRGFNQEMIESSQFIHNLPKGVSHATDTAITLGMHRLHLMYDPTSGLKDLSLQAGGLSKALASNKGIFPGTSPDQLAKGIVSVLNAQDMWLGGAFSPWDRRPLQALGRDTGPTAAAQAARMANPLRKDLDWLHTDAYKMMFGDYPHDLLAKVAYVSEKRNPHFAQLALGGVAGGAGLISKNMAAQTTYQSGLHVNIAMEGGIYSKIQNALGFSSNGQYTFTHMPGFKEGEILGFNSEGDEIAYKEGMKFHGAYEYTDMHQKFLRLEGTQELKQAQYDKYFGSAKAVLKSEEQELIERKILEETGVQASGVNIVLGMAELKKNRSLHNTQLLTGLQELILENMHKGSGPRKALFTRDTANLLLKDALAANNPDLVIRDVWKAASVHKASASQMGRLFGALPDVLGDDWENHLAQYGVGFTHQERAEIHGRGVSLGVGQFFHGGVSTAGGRGGVEPRFFELLGGPQYGALGRAMSTDIANRQILANPELAREQNILTGALSSFIHGAPNMKADTFHVKDLLNDKNMSKLFTKGGIVNMGSSVEGLSSIYVPGQESSSSMREYVTARGTKVYNELQNSYEDFLESAANVENGTGRITRAATMGKRDALVAELGKAYTRTISGKGYGLARKEVMGSKYLRIVASTEAKLGDLRTVGVAEGDVKKMFRDLYATHAGDESTIAALRTQHERILSGGTIGGILARDPDIGPYSIGPTRMKIMKDLEMGNIMIAQKNASVVDSLGNTHEVGLGHMGGRAGDYDGDNAHLMLVSSKIEKDVHGHYSLDNPLVKLDEEYSIRQQLLKAKAGKPVGPIALEAEMIAAAEKLSLSKSKVGPISVPLSAMRAGLANAANSNAITPERFAGASSLLEALENIPILGKHVNADRISTLGEQLDRIATAASNNKPNEMHNITKEIFSNTSDKGTALAGRLLQEGEHVTVNGEKRFIPGINLQQATADLSESLNSMRASSSGYNEDLMRAIELGRRKVKIGDIPGLLAHQGGLLSEFKIAGKTGTGAKLARTAIALGNKLTAIGADVMQHAGKPLAWGLGGAIALSALLSRPVSNMEPGDSSPPVSTGRIDTGAGTQPTPESLHPDSQVSGEPTTSTRMPAPTARVTPEQMSARVRVRGTSRGRTNMGALSGEITRRMPGSTTVNMNVRDKRSSISQQHIDNIRRR